MTDSAHRVRAYLHKPRLTSWLVGALWRKTDWCRLTPGLLWLDAQTTGKFAAIGRSPSLWQLSASSCPRKIPKPMGALNFVWRFGGYAARSIHDPGNLSGRHERWACHARCSGERDK